MNTMSEPSRAWAIFSESSSAARSPIEGSPPAPRPRVILSPMRILCGASDWRRAWASVLSAMNSTPIISARIIRLTALLPPPPTPITLMSAKFSESERRPIATPPNGPSRPRYQVPEMWPGHRRARSPRLLPRCAESTIGIAVPGHRIGHTGP